MDVTKRSLTAIFDPTMRLEAPLFQRPYVWNEEKNWEPLWDSIREVAERRIDAQAVRPHFLGTIVLDQLRTPTGSVNTRQIIDGQQRLTTLQLLLAATRDLCSAEQVEGYPEAFGQLTINRTPLSRNPHDVFKVWPTNVDRKAFETVMQARTREAVKSATNAVENHLIPQAYLYFYDKVSEWLGGRADEKFTVRLTAFFETITNQLNLVVIDLDAQDDAQVIFETLNALGTPLLPADLVKNYLFHAAHRDGANTQELYTRHWEQFDTDQAFWRRDTVRGRLTRPQIDVFLQDYLTLVTGEVVSASHLFAIFRDLTGRRLDLKAADHLEHFHNYADIYRAFENFSEDTREGVFFRRLDVMNSETVLPLLLEVFRRHKGLQGRSEVLQVIGDLESFLVRRMVCALTTQSYTRFFAAMIANLKKADFDATTIRRLLLEQTAEASRWPDDDEFGKAWAAQPMYKKLSKGRVAMIIRALDEAMRDTRAEVIRITGRLTVEHLLPQQWQRHWPLPRSRIVEGQQISLTAEEAEEWREEVVHTIGNLTLLTEKLNSSVSNGPWSAKKAGILHHSALNLNRRLLDVDPWDESLIERRTTELFALAVRVWPHPPSAQN